MVTAIAICELYHPNVHGGGETVPPSISSQYIVREIVSVEEFMRKEYMMLICLMRNIYRGLHLPDHPLIRNFQIIHKDLDYIKLHIVQINELIGEDGMVWTVGCLKTHFIRLLQRQWRAVLRRRKDILRARKHPKALRHRETTGRWHC